MNETSVTSGIVAGPNVADLNWKIKATGDFDGDGAADFLWRNAATGQNTIWLMDANNNFRTAISILEVADSNWEIVGTGDFNKNGKIDILWHNNASGANSIWYMDGTTFAGAVAAQGTNDPNWRVVGATDFDGDTRPDIFWRNSVTGQNVVWMMDNATFLSASTVTSVTDLNWKIGGLGDFNGDGKPDIAWRNYATGQNTIWLMNGTAFLDAVVLPEVTDLNWVLSSVLNGIPLVDLAGNTLATAFNIGTLNASGRYSENVGKSTDLDDYYRFTLDQNVNFTTNLRGLTGNADLELLRDSGNGTFQQVGFSANAGVANEGINNPNLAAGNYLIRVYSSVSKGTPYSLSFALSDVQIIDLLPTTNASNQPKFTLTTPTNQAQPSFYDLATENTIRVNYDISNIGIGSVTSNFDVKFYLSRDNVIDPATDLALNLIGGGNSLALGLAIGASTGDRFTDVILPDRNDIYWLGDQTYYIGIYIDPTSANLPKGQILETSQVVGVDPERNNTASKSIAVRGTIKSDLVGGSTPLAVSVIDGSAFRPESAIRIDGSIQNIGTRANFPTTFTIQFYLSTDDTINPRSDDYLLGSSTISTSIAPGASFSFSNTDIQLPTESDWGGWTPGNRPYYIGFWIDPDNVLQEGENGQTARDNNLNYGKSFDPDQFLDYQSFVGIV
jgi:hypothetical protein